MRSRSFLPVLLVALALTGACGGASDSYDLLGGSGTASTEPTDAASDAKARPDANTGTTVDAGVTTPFDAASPIPEASPVETGPAGTAFTCPPSTCESPDVCCATGTGQGMTPTYKCQSSNKACGDSGNNPGTPIACATTADCPGTVCCGENNLNGYYEQVACEANCTGTAADGAELIQFCDPAVGDCPDGTACQASVILVGYYVCNPA